jgi:hypothetical protein
MDGRRKPVYLLLGLLAMITISTSGCWYAAIQYAPAAIQAARQVASGAVHLTANAIGMADQTLSGDDGKPPESESDRVARCSQLVVEAPGVIELRKGSNGAPEYRELAVAISFDVTQWSPMVDGETSTDGWRQAVNFLQMNFAPPLTAAIHEQGMSYLAYAPAESGSSAEQARLAVLIRNFGTPVGSFTSDGRAYRYAVTQTLPCFPPPS